MNLTGQDKYRKTDRKKGGSKDQQLHSAYLTAAKREMKRRGRMTEKERRISNKVCY